MCTLYLGLATSQNKARKIYELEDTRSLGVQLAGRVSGRLFASSYFGNELQLVVVSEFRQHFRSSFDALVALRTLLYTAGHHVFPVATAWLWNGLPACHLVTVVALLLAASSDGAVHQTFSGLSTPIETSLLLLTFSTCPPFCTEAIQ